MTVQPRLCTIPVPEIQAASTLPTGATYESAQHYFKRPLGHTCTSFDCLLPSPGTLLVWELEQEYRQ